MSSSPSASRRERAAFFAAAILIVLVFTGLRLLLLSVRSPFFDELFTVWIARRSPGGILQALLLDSGPPLYYWMVFWPVHAARGLRSAIAEVPELRLISLLFALVTLLVILGRRRLGESRWMAAILLAFFPAHVYFSGEARAYALCAMFVALGVLALERWASEEEGGSVAVSLAWFYLAACSHYYGALFLAVPLVVALISRRGRMLTDAVIGTSIRLGAVRTIVLARFETTTRGHPLDGCRATTSRAAGAHPFPSSGVRCAVSCGFSTRATGVVAGTFSGGCARGSDGGIRP